jgi:phage anti-repressor protein
MFKVDREVLIREVKRVALVEKAEPSNRLIAKFMRCAPGLGQAGLIDQIGNELIAKYSDCTRTHYAN